MNSIPQSLTNDNQPQLRISARILEMGDKMTKHYTLKKTRVLKTPKGRNSPKFVDPTCKAELVMALQEEAIAANPLNQATIEGIDSICGWIGGQLT